MIESIVRGEFSHMVPGRFLRGPGTSWRVLGVKMASWTVLGGSRSIFGGVLEATFYLLGEVNLHTV